MFFFDANYTHMKNIFALALLTLVLSGCEKEEDHTYYLQDYYTGEPIANFSMSFEQCSSDYYYVHEKPTGKNSYSATSDNSGKFVIKPKSKDKKHTLCMKVDALLTNSDSNNIHWKYYKGAQINPTPNGDHIVKLKPSAAIRFFHPRETNSNTLHDSVKVSVNNQEILMTKEGGLNYDYVYLLPNKNYTIKIEYLNKGKISVKTINFTAPTVGKEYAAGTKTSFITVPYLIPEY